MRMFEPMNPTDRKDLYITLSIIIGIVTVVLTIVAGIVIDALDTAHEEVENRFQMERLAIYERLVRDSGVNPIAVECSLNPPDNKNTPYYALCVAATGEVSEEELATLGKFLPANKTLGD